MTSRGFKTEHGKELTVSGLDSKTELSLQLVFGPFVFHTKHDLNVTFPELSVSLHNMSAFLITMVEMPAALSQHLSPSTLETVGPASAGPNDCTRHVFVPVRALVPLSPRYIPKSNLSALKFILKVILILMIVPRVQVEGPSIPVTDGVTSLALQPGSPLLASFKHFPLA